MVLSTLPGRKPGPHRSRRPAPRCRPRLERLEDRTVLSSVSGLHVVPSTAVNGGLNGTAAIAANDIWAVGSFIPAGSNTIQPLAEHFNGTSWSVVPTPSNPGGEFFSVSGVAGNDVWAVGANGQTNGALIEHWNGSAWSIVAAPPQPGGGWLNSVTAISANNVWAVGFTAGHNLIEHFDGTSWSIVASPTPRNSDLFGVSGTSANDVWAVGETGRSDSRVEILHWNGTAWSTVSAPNASPFANTLQSVTAIAPNDAWAVGNADGQSLIEHWDGTSWSIVASPSLNSGVTLTGISAASANNIWAVGYTVDPATGNLQTVTEHFDGTSWSIIASPGSNQNQKLVGVTALGDGTVAAVGVSFTTGPTGTGSGLILQN
jgi:hypothetical protein